MVTTTPPEFVISPMTVDVDGLFDALNAQLQAHASWNSLRVAATGQSLSRFMAIVGGYGQTGVARAQQEQWFDTMRIPTSVVRACRTLGVHVQRRRAGSVPVTLQRGDLTQTVTIPAYTQLGVGGKQYFCRVALRLPAGTASVPATLYQGAVQSSPIAGDGGPFRRFVIGSPGYAVSDDDVWYVDPTGQPWASTRRGLWKYGPTDAVFQETTLPDGTVELWFGDGEYGKAAPAGAGVANWVEVAAPDPTAPEIPVGSSVSVVGFSTVSGATTGPASLNEAERGSDFYKVMGPKMRAADESVVTRDDYRAYAIKYPGVIDAQFLGEADVAPGDVRWMNVLGATLLTTRPWSNSDWGSFELYLKAGGIATTASARFDPVATPLDVVLNVYAFNRANLADLQVTVTRVIGYLFALQAGSLGALYHPSDLMLSVLQNSIDEAGSLVDYVDVLSPETGVNLRKTSYAQLRSLTVNCAYTTRGSDSSDIGRRLGV